MARGPLVFFLFFNDLTLLLKHCFLDFFADDVTFHTSSSNVINTEIHPDFDTAKSWSKQNKMMIHCANLHIC